MGILAGILHQYFMDLRAEMRHFRPTWKPLVQMLGIMGTATLFSLLMNLFFARNGNISVIYTLAVMLVACVTPGYFYSAIASVLGVLGVNYFFMWPYLAFNFTQTGYPFTFALLFCTSFLTCSIMAAYRHQAERAQRSQRDTQALHTMTNQLLALREEETVTDVVSDWMERACGFPVQYFPQGQEPPATAFLLPVQVGGRAGGAFGVEDGGALAQRPQTAQLLRLFAAQWALVEENLLLARERNRAALEAETERLRSNLLRAISHDLRTPLTSISGAAGVLAESGETLRPQDRAQLSRDIRDNAQWLIRMVENLLSVTRITQGPTAIRKAPEMAEEVLAEAVGQIRRRFPGQALSVKAPAELLMVPMDATLIEQTLINLMENAIYHSQSQAPIQVELSQVGEDAVFTVRDHGKGIPPERLSRLFEGGPAEGNGDARRGMGLGLSICASIVKAHGGEISGENLPEGGALFRFTLPL